jgi:6-methylsalicylate decarboxylase
LTGTIDVHAHFFPPGYVRECRPQILGTARNLEHVLKWTPDAALEEMAAHSIERTILSISAPGLWFGDKRQTRRLARACNEYAAGLVAEYPTRFGFFAAVPMPDAASTVVEIAHSLDVLGADGVGFMTSYGRRWLGDRSFAAVHASLDERRAAAFVHPVVPAACERLISGVPANLMEFAFDTARAIGSLLLSGTMAHNPAIRFAFAHGGGATPMLVDRLVVAEQLIPGAADALPNGVMHELERAFYDVGSVCHPVPFAALRVSPGVGQLVMSTDYPYRPAQAAVAGLNRLSLNRDELAAITWRNAQRLLGDRPAVS